MGHAQSVDLATQQIAEIILKDKRFMEIYQPKVGHHIAASLYPHPMMQAAVLIHLCTKIDGQHTTLDEALSFSMAEFTRITNILMR